MSNLRTKRGMPEVTTTDLGLMTPDDKVKLNGLVDVAEKYVHPTTDGNKHVPENGTTNSGKILTAGAVAGTYTWETAYTHPTGDGNLHVPATSTTNENKVLTAGATAGSLSYKTVAELLGLDTEALALLTAFVAGGTDGQQFTMNNDGTGSWKTL